MGPVPKQGDNMASNQAELQKQSVELRQELKAWEKQFAAANDGRKAGREEIKRDPSIGTSDTYASGLEQCAKASQQQNTRNTLGSATSYP